MSNRTLVELNHDFAPSLRSDKQLMTWAVAMARYLASGDPDLLPQGVRHLGMRHHSDPCPIQTPAAIRKEGWSVAVHNDYWLGKIRMTFWLFTHPSGRFVRGEGRTDESACGKALDQIVALENADYDAKRHVA